MRWKKKMAILCATCMTASLLSACTGGTKPNGGDSPSTQTSASTQKEVTTASTATKPSATTTEQGGKDTPQKKVRLQIDGFDEDHSPRLDGSLANEPLLIRMISDLLDTDADTAETYLADSFVNGGTSTSWGKLLYDTMDLIISYEPPQEVKDDYKTDFARLEIDPLGRDGLVFIVNKNNPIESLTVDQIRDIYLGKITDWSEVGGEPGKIRAFQRNETSGSQTLLNKLVMKGEKPMEPEKELLVGTMGQLIESVASFDGSGSAIGFSVYYYADKMKTDPNLKMIQVEGVTPENASIEDGSYPLVNDFYMAIRTSEESDSKVRKLRDWMLSEDGKTLLEEEGYVWARNGMEPVSNGAGNPFEEN